MSAKYFIISAYVLIISGQVIGQDFTFTSETQYPVDPKPHCVRPADLNNDGHIDLVSANRDSANVTVFIGNGDGTFESGIDYAAGPRARDIAIADYDGDSYLDLAVANEASDSISVLINNGDATYPITVNYLASHADNSGGRCKPWHIESADYNSDGFSDFVVTVTNRIFGDAVPNDMAYLFLNNGDGTFQFIDSMSASDDPRGICAGDFDGDGDFDFAVGSRSGFVDVYKNNGDSTFARQIFSASNGPVDICAADFDGDSDLDIAMLTERNQKAAIMLNDGNGSFTVGSSKSVGIPWSINSADMDGDGDDDLLVAASNGQVISNDGNANLGSSTIVLIGGFPRSICAADFDGDGDNDLSIANAAQFYIITWENTTGESPPDPDTGMAFGDALDYPVGSDPHCVRPADFDNDGLLDLVVANHGSGTVSVLLGNGDLTFQDQISYPSGPGAIDIAIADYDGDQYLDLAVANEEGDSISILINNGDATFAPAVKYLASHDDWNGYRIRPLHIAATDFDGDGHPDLVVTVTNQAWDASPTDKIYLFMNNDDGTFGAPTTLNLNGWWEDPHGLCTGDFDGDGNIDFASTITNVGVLVHYNAGNATFSTHTFSTGTFFFDIVAADFDGDSDLDLASFGVDYDNQDVIIMRNNGYGDFSVRSRIAIDMAYAIYAKDMDGDSDNDVILATSDVLIYPNAGSANLQDPVIVFSGGNPRSVCAADFDGDGDNDLAIATTLESAIVILPNISDEENPTAIDNDIDGTLPSSFNISQNYPNPFNPVTAIEYNLYSRSQVTIEIFDILGRKILTLIDDIKPAGKYRINWDGRDSSNRSVATGIYFYRFRAGDYIDTRKMILIK